MEAECLLYLKSFFWLLMSAKWGDNLFAIDMVLAPVGCQTRQELYVQNK